ncbi:MAG: cytidylate kinase [Candidatus Methanomethylicota archaeon]|uniref:Cytidylate kinase n=1 Tax=Thermoproteota archaeon TaxID=2056631 RepID=A0A497EXA6_9CREN|nr:MAG: cytidylate kinase [Candidatus Verstraetearchaeota archaeon]RLE53967.1 MAG: cytidylate kinase [Candidatus Verstraetearchaeota archaeon]
MKIVITVSGPPGSGKTRHAKRLAEIFGLRYFSTGKCFRELALKHGMTLEKFHLKAEGDSKYDIEVDRKTLEEAKKGNVVLDGHLTGWIARKYADIKIYLTAPLKVRAERIAKRDGKTFEEALEEIRVREESNKKRYMKFYGIDLNDLSIYDIIINTEKWSEEVVEEVLVKLVKSYLEEKK